jgi:hypothetical protein
MRTMQINVVDSLGETELATITKGLSRHAADAGVEPRNHRPLNVVLRSDSGHLLGGLVGATVWVELTRFGGHPRRVECA